MRSVNNSVFSASLASLLIVVLLASILLISGCVNPQGEADIPEANNLSSGNEADQLLTVAVAENLEVPWDLDFLPDGSIILTERPGNIRLIDTEQGLLAEPLATIDEVVPTGEGGLLGIAAHPDFENNSFIYIYYTYNEEGDLYNKVVRFSLQDREFTEDQVIIDAIPASGIHNGGRIRFGPDGLLYITTGDAGVPSFAQDTGSLAGKILRTTDVGSIPEDNPFGDSPVYTFGHRNPQGLAWDEQGRLWATEHGSRAHDELNLIEAGNNYGWPEIIGYETADGMESPVIHSGSNTWAPSGAAYHNDSVFFAGLRGQSLYQASLDPGADPVDVELQSHFNGEFGRLRNVVTGPDGNLYILTSNRDGRGNPVSSDDRMIRVDVSKL
ncbi:PQQ-dependent sugar dehydrogenase [Methanolobus halotolerans]|uniref:Glucose sorbosone dehydrogenase n=1 Tax=Methanolobus halotolerans TaxID=2052935 RepID=A0A4E0Q5D7_9EURY|nr:PQQ-dependent sugar dehydrogenase [Methanolobus halotolerans]TGC09380.1 glucose sorbosone dehydrogenase [Methanolobus halotolerans]